MKEVGGMYNPKNTEIWFNIFPRVYPYNFSDPFAMAMEDILHSLVNSLEVLLLDKVHNCYFYNNLGKEFNVDFVSVVDPVQTNEVCDISFGNDYICVYIYMKKRGNKLYYFTRSTSYEKDHGWRINDHDIAEETAVDLKSQIGEFVTFLNTYLKDLHDDVPKIRTEVSDYKEYMERIKKINTAARDLGILVDDSYLIPS